MRRRPEQSRGASMPWVPALLLLAFLVAAARVDGGVLFTRPLWLDEYHTVLVAGRASPIQVIGDLASGVDLAPPLLHLTTWAAWRLFGPPTPTALHAMSFGAVALGLWFMYLTLHRRFDSLSSLAGTLAMGSHSLLVSNAFEARYYGPWLLFCAFFCWSVGIDEERSARHTRAVLVAIAAVLTCTIHWFGVLSLLLMCGGAGAAWRANGTNAVGVLHRLAPAGAGLVATAVCGPLLFLQRAQFTTPIWVPDLNVTQVVEMARTFFVTLVPLAALLLVLASTFLETAGRSPLFASLRDPGIAALCALALMPVLVTLVSVLVQPTMLPRYAIATVLAWGPLAALAASVLPRTPRWIWCAVLAAVWWVNLRGVAEAKRDFARAVDEDVRAFDATASSMPVVFQSRHVLYPVAARRESQRGAMTLLVLPDSLLGAMFPAGSDVADMQRFFRFERDAVGRHRAAYAFPRLVGPAALDSLQQFLLIGSDASLPRGYKDIALFGRAVFPRHRVQRLRDDLALFTRQ